jgi:hypothetical protein
MNEELKKKEWVETQYDCSKDIRLDIREAWLLQERGRNKLILKMDD